MEERKEGGTAGRKLARERNRRGNGGTGEKEDGDKGGEERGNGG